MRTVTTNIFSGSMSYRVTFSSALLYECIMKQKQMSMMAADYVNPRLLRELIRKLLYAFVYSTHAKFYA